MEAAKIQLPHPCRHHQLVTNYSSAAAIQQSQPPNFVRKLLKKLKSSNNKVITIFSSNANNEITTCTVLSHNQTEHDSETVLCAHTHPPTTCTLNLMASFQDNRVSQYRNVKPFCILTQQVMTEKTVVPTGTLQCKLSAITNTNSFSTGWMPFLSPNQQC